MNTRLIITSFRKELWEFNKTLFWVPLLIAVFIIAAPLLQLMLMEDYQTSRLLEGMGNIDNLPQVAGFTKFFLATIMGIFVPFIMVSLIIQLYYFTTCLYDERRDLSVYFWRSMPVSDALSIGVKLFTGALVVPAVFMVAATLVVLVFLLIALVICTVLYFNYDISLWGLWANADIFSNLGSIWLTMLPYTLWMFPVFVWLMLASMFAKKAPFLWAILPLIGVLLIESFVVRYLQLDSRFFYTTLSEYFVFGQSMLPHDLASIESAKFLLFSVLSAKISFGATLLGIAMLYLTYWLRVNRSEG